MNNRIIDTPWLTPGQFANFPTLSCIHHICYSIKSWIDLNTNNIAIIYCSNGNRSGILVACVLKYMKSFELANEAFLFYCSLKSTNEIAPISSINPSHLLFFENIDLTMNNSRLNHNISTKILHLKNISIKGLPVDDMPCIEIFNTDSMIFSSNDANSNSVNQSKWTSEFGDGSYRINIDIIGDFSLICRFGGEHINTRHVSTLIFKYQNNTGTYLSFLS